MVNDFLDSKPLYYTKFDPQRIVDAYSLIAEKIRHPKRVHLIGTNGKGTTGRALAHLAYKSGLRVGHFSSPHIFDFRERFWIDGEFASLDSLQNAHERLINLLGLDVAEALSYFEYQALLAFVLYENLDLQVIEAGLGGEFDATSVVGYDLTIFTPIGLDHADFLGESLQEVASSKLRAMSSINLVAKQSQEVVDIAKEIAISKGSKLFFYSEIIDSFDKRKEIVKIAKSRAWTDYLVDNISLSCMGLDILGLEYDLQDLNSLELFGRFYKIRDNVTIDVGHNTLAAKAIYGALDSNVDLIFNILSDKDAKEVLTVLKPKVNRVHILPLDTKRATDTEKLEAILSDLDIEFDFYDGKIDNSREYLVFGSFYVVEEFLKSINFRLDNE